MGWVYCFLKNTILSNQDEKKFKSIKASLDKFLYKRKPKATTNQTGISKRH
jgi:hypothetical protein